MSGPAAAAVGTRSSQERARGGGGLCGVGTALPPAGLWAAGPHPRPGCAAEAPRPRASLASCHLSLPVVGRWGTGDGCALDPPTRWPAGPQDPGGFSAPELPTGAPTAGARSDMLTRLLPPARRPPPGARCVRVPAFRRTWPGDGWNLPRRQPCWRPPLSSPAPCGWLSRPPPSASSGRAHTDTLSAATALCAQDSCCRFCPREHVPASSRVTLAHHSFPS